jgi:DNA-binding XRE family transcriptional regulator
MPGHRKFRDLVAHLDADPVRRARIEAGKRAMRDITALNELRERRSAEQPAVAGTTGVSQPTVSQLELGMDDEEDVYLSTLRHYIEALGGRLELTAVFPDETIRLVPAAVESEGAAAARS